MEEEKKELTDDEVYAKLETEKLLRRKKKKTIFASIAMAVTFAIVVTLIVLASVPVSLKPHCVNNDFATVRFSDSAGTLYGGVLSKNESSHKKNFEKFVGLFDKAFEQTYISAIFSGSLSDYAIEDNYDDFVKAKSALSGKNFISLEYETAKTLTYQNGKQYTSKNTSSNGALTFKNAWVEISNNDAFADTKIYLNVTYPSGQENKLIVLTVKANTYKIFKEWKALTTNS